MSAEKCVLKTSFSIMLNGTGVSHLSPALIESDRMLPSMKTNVNDNDFYLRSVSGCFMMASFSLSEGKFRVR